MRASNNDHRRSATKEVMLVEMIALLVLLMEAFAVGLTIGVTIRT